MFLLFLLEQAMHSFFFYPNLKARLCMILSFFEGDGTIILNEHVKEERSNSSIRARLALARSQSLKKG